MSNANSFTAAFFGRDRRLGGGGRGAGVEVCQRKPATDKAAVAEIWGGWKPDSLKKRRQQKRALRFNGPRKRRGGDKAGKQQSSVMRRHCEKNTN